MSEAARLAREGRTLGAYVLIAPGLYDRPAGCLFAPRCAHAQADCQQSRPALHALQHGQICCHHPLEAAA